ncbi:MAG TPA: biopolymer transporter ExbD [Azospirillaceae bacterium]|nr:biopolymer transporter ExbD [Azospirillaceae bacterium]
MGMSVGGGGDEDDVVPDMNTTPLIDVMLVLLVMFIITIPIQTHAVKLDMPQGNPPPSTVQPTVFTVEVDFDGTILWNGAVIPDDATLEAQLTNAAAMQPAPELHVWPNKLVEYKYVAKVLAAAQRLGVNKIGMIGNEQFLD